MARTSSRKQAIISYAWVLSVVAFSTAQNPPAAKDPSRVAVRFISGVEHYTDRPESVLGLQVNSAGQFLSLNGVPISDDELPRLLQPRKEERKGDTLEVRVDFRNHRETTVVTLVRVVEKLKQATPKNQPTIIFLRYNLNWVK